MEIKKIKKTFVKQQDQSDCGVACLSSIIKYYEGYASLESIRELSGTTKQGSTLMGLYQASNQFGFDANGYEANLEYLKDLKIPSILHILLNKQILHYVVYYGYSSKGFLIGDPAEGIKYITSEELKEIWASKVLLQLLPNNTFVTHKLVKNAKWLWIYQLVILDKQLLVICLILGIIISLLGLSIALFIQRLIDDILPNHNVSHFILGTILLSSLLLIRGGVSWLRQYFLITQSKEFNNRIINKFYSNLLYLPKSFFDSRKIGELVARMNDTSRIQNTISYVVGNVLIDGLVVIVSSIIIFFYSIELGLILISSIPIFFLLIYSFKKRIKNGQHNVMMKHAQSESNYINTIQGISAIKAANKESAFSIRNQIIYGAFQKAAWQLEKLQISINLYAEVSGVIIITAIIAFSSYLVMNNSLLIGEMMAIMSIKAGVIPAAVRLALVNIQIQGAKIAFDRMYDFTSLKPEFDSNEISRNNIPLIINELKVENMSFRFPGRESLLSNINFKVKKGEIIGIMGESGSGKSTIIQLLQKFYKYESGEISINGMDFNTIPVSELRYSVGVVSQEISLFNGSLLDNISISDSENETEQILLFCEKYGFNTYFEKFPQSYYTLLGEEGVNISGGQKQLLALARALYKQPQLLLVDEPTSAMDKKTENFVMQLLQNLKPQIAIIMITHRIKSYDFFDHLYLLEDGIIVPSKIKLTNSHSFQPPIFMS